MADSPVYASTVNTGAGALSVANTGRDGSGTVVTLFTAGAGGSRIDKIVCKATVTTTAGTLRFWLHNGSTAYLFHEEVVAANTVSATNPAWGCVITLDGGVTIPTGWTLKGATNNAETFNIIVTGGNF